MSLPLPPFPGGPAPGQMDPMMMDPMMAGMASPPPIVPPMDPMTMGMDPMMMGFDPLGEEEDLSPPPEEQKEPKRKKPDSVEVLRTIDATKDEWILRDERMDEDKQFYDMEIGDETAAGNLVLRNICTTMTEKAARMIGSQEPILSVVPPKNTDRDEAQEVEDFLRHTWKEWNRNWYLSGYSTIYHDMAHFLALRGWLTARIRYNPDATVHEHPIKMRLIDPREVYPMFGEDGLLYVAHVYTQTVAQVKDSYPDAKGEWTAREDQEYVNCKAYYDDWWYGFFIEDEEIIPIQAHEYGFVPWVVMIAGGAPIRHTESDTTDWVANVGPSIFHHVKEQVLTVNRIMSQLADEVERQSNPPLLYFIDPQNKKEPQVINFEPGSQNYLIYDRERVEPLSLGVRSNEAGPLLEMLMEDIEKGGLPSSLWGVGADASGFQATISSGAARDSLYPIVRCMEYAQQELNRQCLTIIRDFHDDDVGFFVNNADGERVSGATINFEVIERIGVFSEVKYKDVSPQDKIAKANIAMALVREKLIDLELARSDYLEIDNPKLVNDRVIRDLVYMDEEFMKGPMTEKILSETDPELYMLWMQHQQQQQMQPAAPPAGGPPGGGMPTGPGAPGNPQPISPSMPMPPPGMQQGLPTPTLPPNLQGMELLTQAAGGAAGGVGLQQPQGVPGAGALPLPMPLV